MPGATGQACSRRSGLAGTLLLLFPHAPESVQQLLAIATETQQAFPDVLSPHVILHPGADTTLAADLPVWIDEEGRAQSAAGRDRPRANPGPARRLHRLPLPARRWGGAVQVPEPLFGEASLSMPDVFLPVAGYAPQM